MLVKHDQNYGMKALWAYVRSLGPLGKPSREWRGLTDEEVYQIYGQVEKKVGDHWEAGGTTMMFPITLYQAIEAKLKEKNT